MGKYFSIAELCRSDAARLAGKDNTPPSGVKVKLDVLINKLLDPIRIMWGKPIYVNSGFRSPLINKMVGGASTSQHIRGEAADITAGSSAANKQLFALIKGSGLHFDQLIDEDEYRWLHISFSAGRNRQQILHKHGTTYIAD